MQIPPLNKSNHPISTNHTTSLPVGLVSKEEYIFALINSNIDNYNFRGDLDLEYKQKGLVRRNLRMSSNLGCPKTERAYGELQHLEPLGCPLGFEIGRLRGVVGGDTVPGGGGGAGPLQRHGDEVAV